MVSLFPRVLQDATTLQMEGTMLRQQLLKLGETVTAVEAEAGHSIQRLQKIDRLKACLKVIVYPCNFNNWHGAILDSEYKLNS